MIQKLSEIAASRVSGSALVPSPVPTHVAGLGFFTHLPPPKGDTMPIRFGDSDCDERWRAMDDCPELVPVEQRDCPNGLWVRSGRMAFWYNRSSITPHDVDILTTKEYRPCRQTIHIESEG